MPVEYVTEIPDLAWDAITFQTLEKRLMDAMFAVAIIVLARVVTLSHTLES
jgi:hypothetical protein